MSPVDDYVLAAQTLLWSCRTAAIKSLPEAAQGRAEEVLRGRRILQDPDTRTQHQQEVLVRDGAAIAAHLVHARLRLAGGAPHDDGVAADVVRNALPLLDADLNQRLAVARPLADVIRDELGGETAPALRDLLTLLTRPGGTRDTRMAAEGHLCRTVKDAWTDTYQPFADLAWWSWRGDSVLVPDAITRAAALALVVVGESKVRVAARAGISRTTLDKWARDEAER